MKKLLIAIGLSVALGASAQQHLSQSFLKVQAVYVTNTFAITNLTFPGNGWPTNQVGTTYTNNNQLIVATNGNYVNLLGKVALPTDRNALPVGVYGYFNTNAIAVPDNTPVSANISLSLTGGSGANSAVTFTFAPLPESDTSGVELQNSAPTGEEWSFSVVANTTSLLNFRTNVPTWRWPGCRGLSCKRIVNADTDASSQVIITSLKLNSFNP